MRTLHLSSPQTKLGAPGQALVTGPLGQPTTQAWGAVGGPGKGRAPAPPPGRGQLASLSWDSGPPVPLLELTGLGVLKKWGHRRAFLLIWNAEVCEKLT